MLAVAAAALTVLVYALTRKPAPTRARGIGARLDLAAGDVTVSDGGTTAKALSGTPLAIGSRIATAKGSRALVRAGDGSAIFLRGDTSVALGDKGIELDTGEVWLDAPRFEGNAASFSLGNVAVTASDAGLDLTRNGDDVTVYVAAGSPCSPRPAAASRSTPASKRRSRAAPLPRSLPSRSGRTGPAAWAISAARARAAAASGRLYGIDPRAAPARRRARSGSRKQVVHAVDPRRHRRDRGRPDLLATRRPPIEGWYWFTVPRARA